MNITKTVNVTFNPNTETVPEFLGLTIDRAHEIQSEIQDGIRESDERNADISFVLNKYENAELVWALYLLAPAEQENSMNSLMDAVGSEDEASDQV